MLKDEKKEKLKFIPFGEAGGLNADPEIHDRKISEMELINRVINQNQLIIEVNSQIVKAFSIPKQMLYAKGEGEIGEENN